jgi:hypothetical protein
MSVPTAIIIIGRGHLSSVLCIPLRSKETVREHQFYIKREATQQNIRRWKLSYGTQGFSLYYAYSIIRAYIALCSLFIQFCK